MTEYMQLAMAEYMQLHQLITRPGDGTSDLVWYLSRGTDSKTLHAVDRAGHTLLIIDDIIKAQLQCLNYRSHLSYLSIY